MQLIEPAASYIATLFIVIIKKYSKPKIPDMWKIASISSVPKIQTPEQLSGYRPVSVLPVLPKIWEKFVLKDYSIYRKPRIIQINKISI